MMSKKIISIVLALSLVFANASVALAAETTTQGNAMTASDGGIVPEESEDMTTEGAITEGAITEGAVTQDAVDDVQPEVNPIQPAQTNTNLSVKAAAITHYVQIMSANGKLTKVGTKTGYTCAKDANTAMNALYKSGTYKGNKGLVVTDIKDKVVNMKVGMAYYKSKASTVTIGNTYITPKDALHFYGTANTTNTSATVGISGAKANVSTSKLILVPGSKVNVSGGYNKDYYYRSSNGDLYHYVYKIKTPTTGSPYKNNTGCTSAYSVHTVDKAPSFMKVGTKYYSADGINYYNDIGLTSKAGGPYYAYYQYLPYRTMSNYNSTQLNKWLKSKTPSGSKLKSQGRNFINAQNRYGVNAVNEIAFACLESAYGTSTYAKKRNNLFGINAVDSNPNNAFTFSCVRVCINQHAQKHLSRGYGDAKTDSRYFGLAPGNKAVGVNVKYASDPWHGEKISGLAYSIDKYLGSKDYRKYKIGVTNKNSVNVYKSAGSKKLYNLSTKSTGKGPTGIPVVILGSSGNYYKIQSDLPISGNTAKYSYTYYFNKSVAYVKKSDIKVVSNGSHTYTSKIAKNKDLRNITVKVGKKNYFSGFNPAKKTYTVKVPKKTKYITIKGTTLMTGNKVTGNGKKRFKAKKSKTYKVKVKNKYGTNTYKIKVVRKG